MCTQPSVTNIPAPFEVFLRNSKSSILIPSLTLNVRFIGQSLGTEIIYHKYSYEILSSPDVKAQVLVAFMLNNCLVLNYRHLPRTLLHAVWRIVRGNMPH